jgi:hypothetical protein
VPLPPAAPPVASWPAWPPTAPAWLTPPLHSSRPRHAVQRAARSGQQAAPGPAAPSKQHSSMQLVKASMPRQLAVGLAIVYGRCPLYHIIWSICCPL